MTRYCFCPNNLVTTHNSLDTHGTAAVQHN